MEFRPIVKNEVSSGGGGGGSVDAAGVEISMGEIRFRFRERLPFEGWV